MSYAPASATVVDALIVVYRPRWDLLRATLERVTALKDVRYCRVLINDPAIDLDTLVEELGRSLVRALKVTFAAENLGFAGGQNSLLAECFADGATHGLVLNPDVILLDAAVSTLLSVEALVPGPSLVSGVLLGPDDSMTQDVDSAGTRWTEDCRHLDLLHAEPAEILAHMPQVYGTAACTGALILVPRSSYRWLVRTTGEFFDEAFFAYREDAELGLRAYHLGVPAVMTRTIVGRHYRGSPGTSRASPTTNWFGIRNRFLLLLKYGVLGRPGQFHRSVLRDLMVIVACFTIERSSQGALKDALAKRGAIWEKRRSAAAERCGTQLPTADFIEEWRLRALPMSQVNVLPGAPWVVIPWHRPSDADVAAAVRLAATVNVVVVEDGTVTPQVPAESSVTRLSYALNQGIAAALNIGASYAVSAGATAFTCLDQDSRISEVDLRRLVASLERHHVGCVGPAAVSGVRYAPVGGKGAPASGAVTEIIQSGMTIATQTFLRVGRFNEGLRIDLVDTDYCLRLRESGLSIFLDSRVSLEHSLGGADQKEWRVGRFRPKYAAHGGPRLYYQNRNLARVFGRMFRLDRRVALRHLRRQVVANMLAVFRRGGVSAVLPIWRGMRDGILSPDNDYYRRAPDAVYKPSLRAGGSYE